MPSQPAPASTSRVARLPMPTTDREDKEEVEVEETITRYIDVLWKRAIKLLSRTDPRASQYFS